MRENASRGFYTGGTTPYGYRILRVQDGDTQRSRLEPDPVAAPVVERMFKECLSGKGLQEIAITLNDEGLTTRLGKGWYSTTVHNVLRNEAYTGVLVWDRQSNRRTRSGDVLPAVRVEGAWPAIISQETFAQA